MTRGLVLLPPGRLGRRQERTQQLAAGPHRLLDRTEPLLDPHTGMVTQLRIAPRTQMLEALATAVEAVAEPVVLPRRSPCDPCATGDADHTRLAEREHSYQSARVRRHKLPVLRIYPPGPPSRSMQVRSRHHLRADAAGEILERVAEQSGVALDADAVEKIEFTDHPQAVISLDGHPDLAMYGEEPFLTVAGANRHPPERHSVTVDAGAVSFVANGADIMRPGIVDADPTIDEGDLVCIREETHGKVLAVGRALTGGSEMVGEGGRVVETIHHVGDELFGLEL